MATAHGCVAALVSARSLATVVALGAVLLAGGAAAQEPDVECLACHGERIDARKFGASAHARSWLPHVPFRHLELPHPERPAVPACGTCHEEVLAAYRQGIHAQSRARGGSDAATCVDCHGDVHLVTPHTERGSPVHWGNLAGTCARCHADGAMEDKFRIPVVRPLEAYLKSSHARAVAAGRHGAVCSDCHGAHDILPSRDPRSSLWPARVPDTCGKCHREILGDYRDSIHGEALARGVADAPSCIDCHGEHGILGRTDETSPVFAANVPGDTCGRCHADTRLSEKYGLPAAQVIAFKDSYHGLALRAGTLTVANCTSCHGAHDILPATDPRSHVHPKQLPQTCGKCHPGAGTVFALGPIHVLPTAANAPAVYWIRLAYLWLIGGVIGAMAAHNLADLLRKARRSLPASRPVGEVRERMPRSLRWQHGLVMVSFTTLAYTGFALTYPESWWAAPVLQWEARFGLRGGLHRLAAVVLLGSLAWHLALFASSRRWRTCLRGLRWSRRDLTDFLGVLRYYVGGRATPPSLGTFSYVEKVEYWAFLWGSALMAITGFVLWFENVALRYLPTWMIDVATTVHFYEAVLATLAILVWHVYWVIFDPDVYPMDASWWHGREPAARCAARERSDVSPDDASSGG